MMRRLLSLVSPDKRALHASIDHVVPVPRETCHLMSPVSAIIVATSEVCQHISKDFMGRCHPAGWHFGSRIPRAIS